MNYESAESVKSVNVFEF